MGKKTKKVLQASAEENGAVGGIPLTSCAAPLGAMEFMNDDDIALRMQACPEYARLRDEWMVKDCAGVLDVPIELLFESDANVRETVDYEHVHNLAESMRAAGVNAVPIVVRAICDKNKRFVGFDVLDGQHRYRALAEIGAKVARADVKAIADDAAALELSMVLALQRRNLNPVDEANGYMRLMKSGKYATVDAMAEALGQKEHVRSIYDFLSFEKLIGVALEALAAGKITKSHAVLIAAEKAPDDQARVLEECFTPEFMGEREPRGIRHVAQWIKANLREPVQTVGSGSRQTAGNDEQTEGSRQTAEGRSDNGNSNGNDETTMKPGEGSRVLDESGRDVLQRQLDQELVDLALQEAIQMCGQTAGKDAAALREFGMDYDGIFDFLSQTFNGAGGGQIDGGVVKYGSTDCGGWLQVTRVGQDDPFVTVKGARLVDDFRRVFEIPEPTGRTSTTESTESTESTENGGEQKKPVLSGAFAGMDPRELEKVASDLNAKNADRIWASDHGGSREQLNKRVVKLVRSMRETMMVPETAARLVCRALFISLSWDEQNGVLLALGWPTAAGINDQLKDANKAKSGMGALACALIWCIEHGSAGKDLLDVEAELGAMIKQRKGEDRKVKNGAKAVRAQSLKAKVKAPKAKRRAKK